jgi:glycosidase
MTDDETAGQPQGPYVSADFMFGTLATDDLRLAQMRAASTGVHHGHDLEPPDPRPGEAVRITVTVGGGVHADHLTCYYTTDGSDPAGDRGHPTRGSAVAFGRTGVTWDTLTWAYVETWSATIPPQPTGTLVRYRMEAWAEHDRATTWATETAGLVAGERPAGVDDASALILGADSPPLWPVPRHGSFAYNVDDEAVPDWLRDAVIYQVFIDRFATTGGMPFAEPATPGGFYGGTLRGVIERLDHIAKLGVTCIWLSPLFPSPSHHGYDATDLRTIEPRFGTEDDLRDLLTQAHAAGMRVILDFAANHVSSGHPAFQRALRDRDSPEASWFTFTDWPQQYLSFFGVADHPQVDCDDPAARDYMIGSATRWLEFGVDGFRCDYAQGPSHAFWSAFRAETRRAHNDAITIGEIVETPALQRTYRGRMDGWMDFLLNQTVRSFFAFGDITVSDFDAFLRRHLAFFDGDFVVPSFLDNHDMNRFLWIVRGDVRRLRLAALCQFTLPSPPIVYYGTEVGLSQRRDVRYADGSGHPEESRLPMLWGSEQDSALLDFYRRLIHVRQADPSLWRGDRTTIELDDAAGLYAYRCVTRESSAIVVLNTGSEIVRFGPDRLRGSRIVLATDDGVAFDRDQVTLPASSGAIFMPAGSGRPDHHG